MSNDIKKVVLFRFFILLVLSGFVMIVSGCGGSVISSEIYDSGKYKSSNITRLAVMPIIIINASKTSVSSTRLSTYEGYWLSEKSRTITMSPAEYLPAENTIVNSISSINPNIDVVGPRKVESVLKHKRFNEDAQAIVEVAQHFKSDVIISIVIRNLNLRGGGAIEGHSGKGQGHVDISLYNPDGKISYSISSNVKYQKGTQVFNMIPDPAPSLSDFIGYVMQELRPKLTVVIGNGMNQ